MSSRKVGFLAWLRRWLLQNMNLRDLTMKYHEIKRKLASE